MLKYFIGDVAAFDAFAFQPQPSLYCLAKSRFVLAFDLLGMRKQSGCQSVCALLRGSKCAGKSTVKTCLGCVRGVLCSYKKSGLQNEL